MIHHDLLLQALQLGFIEGIIVPGPGFDHIVTLFGSESNETVIEGIFFLIDPMEDGSFHLRLQKVRKRTNQPVIWNSCECRVCLKQVDWTNQNTVYCSGCKHGTFWAAFMIAHESSVQSFSTWLAANSSPYIPLFGSVESAEGETQTPLCRNEEEFVAKRSLLAPPESLECLICE